MSRLSLAALGSVRSHPDVVLPPPGTVDQTVGILHLGIGAFHRAHQAVITQEAAALSGETRWGICGVTQRSDSVQRQLRPQDGLYAVLERSPERTRVQVIGSVREVLYPGHEQAELDARFDDPGLTVITLTITEKGYRRDGSGRLDRTDPLVAADLAGGPPFSAVGRLVRGLQTRARGCGAPITVLSCDNLTANGEVLAGLVADFCAALPAAEGEPLLAWIQANTAFPCSMVDRIVPATTAADRQDARALLGLDDEGLVVAEPFRQWVIEDRFVADRPAWERAGAQLTKDVAPYELMKLRILNGSHSTLAYLGALAGYPTIAETVADEALLAVARQLITEDVIPVLRAPDGLDLAAYGEQVLHRYTNPALAHRTVQIAMDGSQKLPLRLLGTIRDNLQAGRHAHAAVRGVAAWMAYLASEQARNGMPLPIDDPLAAALTSSVRGRTDPATIVNALLAYPAIFGADLPSLNWFRDELTDAVTELLVP